MEKENLYKYLDRFIENYNRFIIMVLFLKDIIEQSENDDITIQELEYDLQEIEILFLVQTERIMKFENKLKEMYQRYKINKAQISAENIQSIIDDLVKMIDELKEKK